MKIHAISEGTRIKRKLSSQMNYKDYIANRELHSVMFNLVERNRSDHLMSENLSMVENRSQCEYKGNKQHH